MQQGQKQGRNSSRIVRAPDPLGMLWRVLRQPWLLVGVGATLLVLILSAFLLPQISTPIASDPSSSARWFNTVSTSYGAAGNLLRGLGLFDLLHSTLLRVLLLVLGLLLAVHFAEQLAEIALFRSLKRLLHTRPTAAGEAVVLPQALPIYRMRESQQKRSDAVVADAVVADAVAAGVAAHLTERFGPIEQLSIGSERAENSHPESEGADVGGELVVVDNTVIGDTAIGDAAKNKEVRLLAVRHQLGLYIRPLMLLGLLLGLSTTWLITSLGWEVVSPSIPPGESYSYPPQNLELQYSATAPLNQPESPLLNLALQVKIGDESGTLPVDSDSSIRIGDVAVEAQPGPPGLLVSSVSGAEILAIQDQPRASAGVGLIFPGEGNEQVVRLPEESIGLRIVRSSREPEPDYLIEIISVVGGIERDSQQVEIQNGESKYVALDSGTVSLRFDPLPALDVRVRYLPNAWLLMVTLGLVVAGAVGFLFRPAFVLAQIRSWHGDTVAVIAQSNSKDEMQRVKEIN